MRPKKIRRPFTLYRKETQTGPIWYARFWDETARRYAVTRSTGIPVEGKRQRRYEAEQAAREMLGNIQFIPAAPEKSFVQYVADFWLPDSPYVREYALVKKRPLAIEYVLMNHENVRRHMEPFSGFQDITFRNLTPGIIKDWLFWAAANGRGARSINVTLQAMRIPVRYALSREEIDRDPFRNIREAPEGGREKGILSPAEVSRIITSPTRDPWARLVVLLGILCGLRPCSRYIKGYKYGQVCHTGYISREILLSALQTVLSHSVPCTMRCHIPMDVLDSSSVVLLV